jgi:hypothetical protein
LERKIIAHKSNRYFILIFHFYLSNCSWMKTIRRTKSLSPNNFTTFQNTWNWGSMFWNFPKLETKSKVRTRKIHKNKQWVSIDYYM